MEKQRFRIDKNEKLIAIVNGKNSAVNSNYTIYSTNSSGDQLIMGKPVITDVNPRDGDALLYNSQSKLWYAGTIAAGAGTGFTTASTTGSVLKGTLNNSGLNLGVPAWLTNAAGGGAGTGFSSTSTAGADIAGTLNSAGLSFGVPKWLTTAAQSNHTHSDLYIPLGNSTAYQTSVLSGTFQTTGNYLTTAALSNHAHSLDEIRDPANNAIFNMNTRLLRFQFLNSFATNATREAAFEIDCGAAFDGDLVHIHHSAGVPSAGADLVHLEAAGTNVMPLHIEAAGPYAGSVNKPVSFGFSALTSPFVLDSNASSVVASLNADMVDGKHSSDFLTTAAASNHTHSDLYIPLGGSTNFAGIGETTGTVLGTDLKMTVDTAGVNINFPKWITTARASNDAVGLNTARTNVTWTVDSSGLSLNAAGYAGTGTSATNASITMNSNGLAISVADPGGGAGATLSHYEPPWAFSGRATNSSLGQNTLYFMPFDLPYYLRASRINFYISISGALLASNSTGTCQQGFGYALYTRNMTGIVSNTLSLLTSYSVTHLSHSMSSNTRYAVTHYFGLSDVTSHSTYQTAISSSNASTYLATNLNGPRVLALPMNLTLTPGRYWLAVANSTVTGNAMTNGLSVQMTSVGIQPGVYNFGSASAATNASVFRAQQGFGSYSATSNAFPNSIAYSTDAIRHGVAMTQVHFDIRGFSTSTNQV